ncbi:hypothetical protein [Streptomyces sp. NPDC001809]
MTRTTPPRPLDVEALFPELAAHRGTTTRLHPRPGRPGVSESSVGGPMLWPADEPWPVCTEAHERGRGRRPGDVRRSREVMAAAYARKPYEGLTKEEQRLVGELERKHRVPGGWTPLEEQGLHPSAAALPTGVVVGNHGELHVFTCPTDPGHPARWSVQ